MGKHSSTHVGLVGRFNQLPGKHLYGIGMIPVGDRERGDPKYDTTEERPNNDPHLQHFR